MLLPACVLVVLLLASVAADMSLVHLHHRRALDAAASAADDAVTAGADRSALRSSGDYRLDPASVESVVHGTLARSGLADDLVGEPEITVRDDTVEVGVRVEVDYVFAGAAPGAPGGTVVAATASATAHEL